MIQIQYAACRLDITENQLELLYIPRRDRLVKLRGGVPYNDVGNSLSQLALAGAIE